MNARPQGEALPEHEKATTRHARGQAGEDAAAALLRAKGLRLVARNWRAKSLELDIVAYDGDTLVFVEVRTRSAGGLVTPAESLSPAKRRSFIRAARAYLAAENRWDAPCRFDLVCVIDTGRTLQTEHLTHVVNLSESMDCGNTAWQPW